MSDEAKLLEVLAGSREGVLATIRASGLPQLSNILYIWDPAQRMARISTTAVRAKAKNLRRDPRASLYVPGSHFWSYVVAEADAELRGPTTEPGDEAGRELLEVHSAFYEKLDEQSFFREMVDNQRLVIRLRVSHLYGVVRDAPPGSE
jgi:PPOX class probable F420-dependent enzyme